jgi:hypothetical protein
MEWEWLAGGRAMRMWCGDVQVCCGGGLCAELVRSCRPAAGWDASEQAERAGCRGWRCMQAGLELQVSIRVGFECAGMPVSR